MIEEYAPKTGRMLKEDDTVVNIASLTEMSLGQQNGTMIITPVDDNYLVTTTDMKVGTYTIAAQPKGSHVVTVEVTAVGTDDTMGTITFVGTDSDGAAVTETLTPEADATVTGTKGFEAITSITGAGWVIDAVEGTEDTIIVGVGAIKPPEGKYIYCISALTDTVIAAETFVTGSAAPKLVNLTSIPAGEKIYGKWATITPTSGEAVAYFAEE
jgi:hypothetical protein